MIDKLRNVIAEHITKYGRADDWEQIRLLYAAYSYVAFLMIALDIIGKLNKDIKKAVEDTGLEAKKNIEYLLNVNGTESLINEMQRLLSSEKVKDINALYQEFLSIDYNLKDEKIVFESGKNNRDTLGSYYTQEEFAYEITQRGIEEFLNNCQEFPTEVKIVDYSCGGGVFLIAAKKICKKMGIHIKLLGVDVDPIAVMITRARLMIDLNREKEDVHVVLGNPLIRMTDNVCNSFEMALKGRYYFPGLGIDLDEQYDVVLGNPPWEKIRFEEKKFLAHFLQRDAIDTKANRENAISNVSDKNKLYYYDLVGDYEKAKISIKNNDNFRDTRGGELNTYALFTEYALNQMSVKGIIGLIIKSSLLKMPVYSEFMEHNMNSKRLYEIYMFVNRKKIFNIDSREEFSIVFCKNQNSEDLKVAVNLDDYRKFYDQKKIKVTKSMLELLNPETGMLPNIKSNEELEFLCRLHSNNPTFGEQYKECHFGRLVHLTNHSKHIVKEKISGYMPIYEGKFIELYNGKYATFKDMNVSEKYKSKASARLMEDVCNGEYPESRYFIDCNFWDSLSRNFQNGYIVAWRSLTSATNRRTMLATVLPKVPTCQSIQLLQMNENDKMIQILVLFNSIIFDYIVRLKMAGLDLTQTIIKQIPVPKGECFERKIEFKGKENTIKIHIMSRLKTLYLDDARVNSLFENDLNYAVADKSRKQVIAELDCLVGYLYGLEPDEIKKIAKTFDKYYTKDEVEQWF